MSRLLPETLYCGLFPGHCWLQRKGAATAQSFPLEPSVNGADLLLALESMLESQSATLRKGTRLAVTVSDTVAAVTALPWQEALREPEELNSYARICFEKTGLMVDDSWVMHTEFRTYGAMGLAYALPQEWMTELDRLVNTKGLRLTTVLPVSAAAYCAQPPYRLDGVALVLLQEATRCSALMYSKEGLLGLDVEPVIRSAQESGMRLLKRTAAYPDRIAAVTHWSPAPPELTQSPDFIADCLPDAVLHRVARGAWS